MRWSWALTEKKSQGLTLVKEKFDIRLTERIRIKFIAISHVYPLGRLRIILPLSYDYYYKMKREIHMIWENLKKIGGKH